MTARRAEPERAASRGEHLGLARVGIARVGHRVEDFHRVARGDARLVVDVKGEDADQLVDQRLRHLLLERSLVQRVVDARHPADQFRLGQRGLVAELVQRVDDAAFAGAHVAADVTGADLLLEGCVREEVSGQLLDGEPVEWFVRVKGVDDPLAIRPNVALRVDVITVRIGVAGGVEPELGLVFAITRRIEKPVHQLLIGLRIFVGEKRVHFLDRRR